MDLTALAILVGLAVVLLIVPVFGTLFIAGIAGAIFVWRKIFPLGWGISEWVTNRRNLIPFVLFMLIVIAASIILLILSYLFATQVHWVGFLFLLLFFLILVVAEIIFWGGIGLAVVLWIVRLSHWAYARFRTGFWRTFRPGGPPDFQPVPIPLTNPVSVAPLPSKPSHRKKRQNPLAKRRAKISATFGGPSQEKSSARAVKQAQVKNEANRRRSVARRRETSPTTIPPPSEMTLTRVDANRAKAQAKEDAKQARIQAKEDARKAKVQAKEKAKKAKAEQKAQAKEQAERKEEEKEKGTLRLRRKRRLKGKKPI